jgi:hypothetical protein
VALLAGNNLKVTVPGVVPGGNGKVPNVTWAVSEMVAPGAATGCETVVEIVAGGALFVNVHASALSAAPAKVPVAVVAVVEKVVDTRTPSTVQNDSPGTKVYPGFIGFSVTVTDGVAATGM